MGFKFDMENLVGNEEVRKKEIKNIIQPKNDKTTKTKTADDHIIDIKNNKILESSEKNIRLPKESYKKWKELKDAGISLNNFFSMTIEEIGLNIKNKSKEEIEEQFNSFRIEIKKGIPMKVSQFSAKDKGKIFYFNKDELQILDKLKKEYEVTYRQSIKYVIDTMFSKYKGSK